MKNPRTVYGLIAFAVAFVFSVGLVRILFPAPVVPIAATPLRGYHCDRDKHLQKTKLATRIEEFIEQDKNNGDERETLFVRTDVVSPGFVDSVREYYDTSSAMDTGYFPRDFVDAWQAHMKAWRNYADFLKSNRGKKVNVDTFYANDVRYNDDISSTWDEVIRLAREYGADVTR